MKAEYIDHMGSDLTIVNSARVSFDKESGWVQQGYVGDEMDGVERPLQFEEYENYPLTSDETGTELTGPMLSRADSKLIHFLARHGHWTPFAHCMVTMRETVPIFLARQRFKHIVGFVYNEVSRRYVSTPPEFYTPTKWRAAAKDKKQGSSNNEVFVMDVFEEYVPAGMSDNEVFYDKVMKSVPVKEEYERFITTARSLYDEMLAAGVCPEQARMILPQSMYTSYYVTGSLPAWARLYKARQDETAQKEWEELLPAIDSIMADKFPVGWSALKGE